MKIRGLAIALLAVAAATLSIAAIPSPASAPTASRKHKHAHRPYPWRKRVRAARHFAKARAGSASFAVVGERGRLRGYKPRREFHSASVVKAMLMVCYLRQRSVRHRRLHAHDRELLGPMIRRSDNARATIVRDTVGNDNLHRLARAAHMRDFHTDVVWGLTRISARDMSLFMYRLRRYIPRRHRRYAFHLLSHIVSYERWGVPPAKPRGWKVYFKGGWTPAAGGWRINQVARLSRDGRRLGLAVLTQGNPSLQYGAKTVQGVTARLLRRYNAITGSR